jgi:hypothetical protein
MADFMPQQVSNRVFHFVVASKNVVFMFTCCDHSPTISIRFSSIFGGNGGPNWIHEYGKFVSEEANQWTMVH